MATSTRIGHVLETGFFVHEGVHGADADKRHFEIEIEAREVFGRRIGHEKRNQEGKQRTRIALAASDAIARIHDRRRQSHADKAFHYRARPRAEIGDLPPLPTRYINALCHLGAQPSLEAEGFDDTNAEDRILQPADDLPHALDARGRRWRGYGS